MTIQEKLLKYLAGSEYWTDKTRQGSETIQNLVCPECGSKSAWAYTANPFSVNCNRLSKCGARTKTLPLFPEITKNLEKEHPPTPEDPQAPAREFLNMRGIHKSLKGLEFQYWTNVRKCGSGAVMFPLIAPAGKAYNGRLFNPPKGEGKTHNQGSTKGAHWRHPGITYDRGKETLITEGIIDALSLIEMGKQAIAVLASGQDPANVDLSDFPIKVFCFDNDPAGHKAFKKWTAAYPGSKCLTPRKGDWNDLLATGNRIDSIMASLEHHGRLALSETAEEWAGEYKNHYGCPPGLFLFDGQFYYANAANDVRLCGKFSLDVDHYRLDTSKPEEPVFRYQVRVKPVKGPTRVFTVSPQEIATDNAMTTMLLTRANLLWDGEKHATRAMLKRIVGSGAPVIRQLEVKGRDTGTGNYIFRNFMIDNNSGKFIKINGDGYYRVGQECLRPAQTPDLMPVKGKQSPKELFHLMDDSWPMRAVTALGWVVASWFVDDIKEKLKFFPLLSLYGDSQTGKSNLCRILNACQCVDEEGIPMKKANTEKGILRKLAQRSCLFQALLEEGKDKTSKFDYRFVLTAFNDAPLQIRAEKSMDNTTVETQLHAAIMFVQNHEPFQSKPEKERVISLEFKDEHLDKDTATAFETIGNIPPEEFAIFYQTIMQHHPQIKANWYAEFTKAKEELRESVKDARIREVHSIALAFYRILCERIGVDHAGYDISEYIKEIANRKIMMCRDEDVSVADIFLDAVINATGDNSSEFVSKKEERLYIYMPMALGYARDIGLMIPMENLLTLLKGHKAYKGQKAHRFNNMNPKKAWLFDAKKIETHFAAECLED